MFSDFALILALAAGVGLLAARLRQPTIVAFIVVGILVGPAALGWVGHSDAIELLSQLGITVLLFLVGLKLDPALVRQLGLVALATGLGQLAFTIAFGFLIALALGMDRVTAIYVAVALTFSSTIIIIKLLGDKRELDSLHGRIATGFLIVQDIAVVAAMMVIGALGVGEAAGADGGGMDWLAWTGQLVAGVVAVFLLIRYGLRWVLPWMASTPELMVVFSVAWGVALAAFGEHLGLSKEVGAFVAGFALAGTPFREAVGARLAGLRDFLLLFFFVHLGSGLVFSDLGSQLPAALALSVFVLVGNPLIVMAIMGFMGYRRRTGFMAGLTVAQISEFSVIFIAMGVALGHVGSAALSLVTLVGLVTIALSSYMILYSHPLFERVQRWLGVFERRDPWRERGEDASGTPVQVVVFGVGRYGARLMSALARDGVTALGVDFDPVAVAEARALGLDVHFGDAEDAEFAHSLPLAGADLVVATLADAHSVTHLRRAVHEAGFDGRFVAAARMAGAAEHLQRLQVDVVLDPFDDAAEQAADTLRDLLSPEAAPRT
ncbi:cation:proton antiporter [Luteimonas saliphila]|uniref:cation:proton antiporter n=1 Tax=Luteimonas saliphila TaxID=2804919 RepID=UPI00192D60EB|nr:cation:proton antiporter [Luteimonas saliphila]